MTLDQAAELAMFNSREYQDQRENLYLAALPVTQERFSFMAQFFAAERGDPRLRRPRRRRGPGQQLDPQQRHRLQQGAADRRAAAAQLLQPDRLQLPQSEEDDQRHPR